MKIKIKKQINPQNDYDNFTSAKDEEVPNEK